jgi:hypothetical protein
MIPGVSTAIPAGQNHGPHDDLRAALERLDTGVVVRRMGIGLARLPAYTRFLWRVDRDAVVRWNVDLVLRWMIDGTPPDAYTRSELYELLRARAEAGQPIEDSILVYRRGARLFWDALLDLSDDAGRAALAARANTVWECLEQYLDIVVELLAQAYGDHRELPATAGDRRARALFDRLCAHLPLTVEDRERAARLGFDLGTRSCPFVAKLLDAPIAEHARLAARLRAAGALAFTEGVQIVGLVPAGFDWREYTADVRLLLTEDPPTPRSRLAAAADGLRALAAIAAGTRHRGGRARVEDYLPELLLADSGEIADRIARRVFAPFEQGDTADLAETLRCLAANGFNSAATAAALPVHRNTLLYRVNRIEKLTGLSLGDQRDRTLVLLAVSWEAVAASLRSAGGLSSGP